MSRNINPNEETKASSEFRTPGGLKVRIFQGDITQVKCDAIVNSGNPRLVFNCGVAKAIATAAGQELRKECEKFITENGSLRTTQVMHTSSGKLKPNCRYVIHASGPSAVDFPDMSTCQEVLKTTFMNCFQYANDVLKVRSIAVPAITSGCYYTYSFFLPNFQKLSYNMTVNKSVHDCLILNTDLNVNSLCCCFRKKHHV